MSNFENLLTRLIQNPRFLLTFLVGGLLCFVPVLHFFAFGYLYRMTKILRVNGTLELPEWEDLSRLFLDGIRLTIVLCRHFRIVHHRHQVVVAIVVEVVEVLEGARKKECEVIVNHISQWKI